MKMKKQYEVGTAAQYISRTAAVKKLQISLKDFQRLCILKGIYPRDPAHKKKANKGSTSNKFREYKTYMKKLVRATSKKEEGKAESLREHKPQFELDHLVKERYPTFASALRDLDDCLNLLFAFAMLPKSKSVKTTVIDDCRRLTAEFLHYVIQSQTLSKSFITIKGTYFQASIMGETVTWIVGHQRSVGKLQDVDLSTMANFVDFYTTLLSFVNFRLYKSIGLIYPPQLVRGKGKTTDEDEDAVYSLAHELVTSSDVQSNDVFSEIDGDEKLQESLKIRSLFKGLKFFLNREVPTENLALIIRNCGGIVSWEHCPNAKYDINYEGITHHVIDRPINEFSLNRSYIQPQWVVDSLNKRQLQPVNLYAPGTRCPDHLSPFVKDERIVANLSAREKVETLGIDPESIDKKRDSVAKPKPIAPAQKKSTLQKIKKQKEVKVTEGQVFQENQQRMLEASGQTKKLRELMIPKKHKTVYKKMQFGIKRQAKEANTLQAKRKRIDAAKAAAEE
uniref:Pescadillo homolog n=1 Tax=Panagrellus redivivus TaxID=6233 RepID=A0A7E4W8S1_PANRE